MKEKLNNKKKRLEEAKEALCVSAGVLGPGLRGPRSQGADEWEVTDDREREGDRPRPGNQGSAQTHTAVGSGSQRTAGPAPARDPLPPAAGSPNGRRTTCGHV